MGVRDDITSDYTTNEDMMSFAGDRGALIYKLYPVSPCTYT